LLKRIFDIVFSSIGLVVLSPMFAVIWIMIKLDSSGPVIFKQKRVGKDNQDFTLLKFRTMRQFSEQGGSLTIGMKDKRVTRLGHVLRKYKLDEFPQLFNVLRGEMTLVGPRPEVRKFVKFYNEDQKKVLSVKPGITDMASILYKNENELLGSVQDPEKFYIEKVMPEKIRYNLDYINERSVFKDFKVILKTLNAIWLK